MLESLLILLAGGIFLSAALAAPHVMLRIAGIILFPASIFAGWRMLHSNPQVPPSGAILGCAGVSILAGLPIGQLILCHLVTPPSIKFQRLAQLNKVLILAMVLRMSFGVCAPLMEVRWPTGDFWQEHSIAMAIRWLVLIIPMILLCLAQQHIRRERLITSMKFLYPAAIMILIGEAIALHLTQQTGLPF